MKKNKKDLKLHTDPDERDNRHRRKADKKPYRLECRRLKDDCRPNYIKWIEEWYGDKAWAWHDHHDRYERERDRDNALAALRKKEASKSERWQARYEYRIPPEEEKI